MHSFFCLFSLLIEEMILLPKNIKYIGMNAFK